MVSGFKDYGKYDGLGLADLVKTKRVKPGELVEEAISRIEKINPKLNAVITRAYDSARKAAERELPDGQESHRHRPDRGRHPSGPHRPLPLRL